MSSKIVAIGDSITYGFPYNKNDSWVNLIGKKLGFNILNKGICGDLTKDILDRFEQDVINNNPSHVIILGGANDATWGIPLNQIAQNIEKMINISIRNNIIPVVGLPTPCTLKIEELRLEEYRYWLKKFSKRENIPLIDFYSPFYKNNIINKELLSDEIHPSIKGYNLMAEAAENRLKNLIIIK